MELGIVYKLEGRDEDAVKAYVRAIRAGRWSASGKKAQVELATVQPDHPMARRAWATSIEGKVFNTERYRTALASLERRFGGVVKDAPEAVVLEKILSRILAAADVPPEMNFKVHLLKSGIVAETRRSLKLWLPRSRILSGMLSGMTRLVKPAAKYHRQQAAQIQCLSSK